jgi:hypothetical protein
MNRKFVGDVDGKYKIALRGENEKPIAYLLWGDPVRVVTTSGDLVKVKARGREGWIPKDMLTDESLLEIYRARLLSPAMRFPRRSSTTFLMAMSSAH